MATIDPQKFWEIYRTLPEDLQNSLFSDDVQDTIERICKRYNIENCADFISEKSGDVYLGLLTPSGFAQAVRNQLKTDPEASKKIIAELVDYLLRPVGASLAKLYKLEAPAQPAATVNAVKNTAPAATMPITTPLRPTPAPTGLPKIQTAPARPTVAPITQPQKSIPLAPVTKPTRTTLPRTAQSRPSAQPQTQSPAQGAPLAQDGPTLSAAPSGLRRKVF